MTSKLTDLFSDSDSENSIIIDKENVYDTIFDLDLSEETRLEALEKYHNYFYDDIISVINELNTRYLLVKTNMMKNYLESICYKADIAPELKLEIAKSLTGENNDDYTGFDIIKELLKSSDYYHLPTPCLIDGLIYWMQADQEKYSIDILIRLYEVCDDIDIECDYRFRTLLSIHKQYKYYGQLGLYHFLNNEKGVYTMYKILSAQVLLQDEYKVTEVSNKLLEICDDTELDYNLRADAADTLLHLGIEDLKERARDIIITLGGRGKTLYDNAQNVHSIGVEDSVQNSINLLSTTPILIQWDSIIEVFENDHEEGVPEKIKLSLNRISLDQTLYGDNYIKLNRLFLLVWNYMCEISKDNNELYVQLKNRMYEELEEMSNTCSSGHAARLISVLSGFTDINVSIDFQEQIIANVSARLFWRLQQSTTLTKEEKLEISTEFLMSAEFDKPHFMKFFREQMPEIKEELWEEFCNNEKDGRLISDEEFDTYLRTAIIRFTYN